MKRKISLSKRATVKGHSQRPGTHGKAPRAVQSSQRTLPLYPTVTIWPAQPRGKATTKANSNRLPRS